MTETERKPPPASNPLLSFDDALERLLARAEPRAAADTVPTMRALGRFLAADVRSALAVPPADNTQMDGYALRAADVPAAGTRLPVTQRIAAGHVGHRLAPGSAARIFTGALIPPGADAVVMQEQCRADGSDAVIVDHVPQPGDWIRRRGMDIAEGDVILRAGQRLRPQDLGLAASVGLASLPVARPLRVALLFTGDELAMPGERLRPGAIYNSNRFVLNALLQALGCEVRDFGQVPDKLEATRKALVQAAELADVIITSGGVSVGDEDHVKPAVEAEGAIDLWQVAIKPGKPLAYGHVRRAGGHGAPAHFIGLPGNPVSSFVTYVLFVHPFLLRLLGVAEVAPRALRLPAGFEWPRPDRRREFLRARLGADGRLELFPSQNSAVLSSTVWADGLVDNPPGQAIAAGDLVRFLPFSNWL
jgi:molybdopterin molybdotransferase